MKHDFGSFGKALKADKSKVPERLNPNAKLGTFFDENLDLKVPESNLLVEEVLSRIAAVDPRRRASKACDRERRRTLVTKVLANAMRCSHFRKPSRVAFFRKADGYPDAPDWLSGKALTRVTVLLEKAGLLKVIVGQRGIASTYDMTDDLYRLTQQCDVGNQSIIKLIPKDTLVRLYTAKPERRALTVPDTAEVREWSARLSAYNSFVATQVISPNLPLDLEKRWIASLNRKMGAKAAIYSRPETVQTGLYRSFINGTLLEGGRLYGGWWINAPSYVRASITINGMPTVELDYSCHHLRMLYHERGLDLKGDAYQLDQISTFEREQGLPFGYYRQCIKKYTQALINAPKYGKPSLIDLPDGVEVPAAFKAIDIIRMIEAKHKPISDAFRTGAGLRLQRIDSDLALDIIDSLRKNRVVALPVHDSFLVPVEYGSQLMSVMSLHYKKIFNREAIIDKK